MPRNITVTFADGTNHVYQNAPDNVTPDQVSQRAQQEFNKPVAHMDGGNQAAPATWMDRAKQLGQSAVNTVAGLGQAVAAPLDAVTHAIGAGSGYAVQGAGHIAGSIADAFGGGTQLSDLITGNHSLGNRIRDAADKYGNALQHPVTIGGAIEQAAPTPQDFTGRAVRLTSQLAGAVIPASGMGAIQSAATDMAGITPAALRANAFTPAAPTILGRVANAFGVGGNGQNTTAAKLVAQKLAEDHMTPGEAATQMQTATANGQPMMLADMGDSTRALAADIGRQPGAARVIAQNAVRDRQIGDNPFGTNTVPSQSERVQTAISRDLGPVNDPIAASQALSKQAKTDAAPLYEKAFQGGSMAPLQSQFENAFNDSSKGVSQAAQELSAAQQQLTLSKAGVSRAGENVYQNAKALPADRNAQAAVQAAEQKMAQAQAQHQQVTDVMRQAQGDASSNAPGAIWSPRIQQFLDDPIAKQGLARGMEIQRLESLAEGKPFNPTEYAVTGSDESGNPIVSGVPNMRTLDAVKHGLDDIIESAPKGPNGKPQLDQRGRAVIMVKNALVKQLDIANPDYAEARAAYAGPSQMRDAMQAGNRALSWTADKIRARTSELSQPEKDQFWLGMRSSLSQKAAETNDGVNVVRTLIGSGAKRDALSEAAGGQANIENFMQSLEREQQMNTTYGKVSGGSTTAGNALENMSNNATLADNAIGHFGNGGSGKGFLLNMGVNQARGALRYGVGEAGKRAREDAASLLFTSSPNDFMKSLNQANTSTQAANRAGTNALLNTGMTAAKVAAARQSANTSIQADATRP